MKVELLRESYYYRLVLIFENRIFIAWIFHSHSVSWEIFGFTTQSEKFRNSYKNISLRAIYVESKRDYLLKYYFFAAEPASEAFAYCERILFMQAKGLRHKRVERDKTSFFHKKNEKIGCQCKGLKTTENRLIVFQFMIPKRVGRLKRMTVNKQKSEVISWSIDMNTSQVEIEKMFFCLNLSLVRIKQESGLLLLSTWSHALNIH